jgi:drug/metabolite transporter (DMT)-like permease
MGIIICILLLFAFSMYAILKLYILRQRVDASVIVINFVLFTAVTGVMIYLSKKQKDNDEQAFYD